MSPERTILLTPAGRARLVRRIEEARAAYRAVCAGNEEAAQAGDSSVWHDNFAYEENQRQMHQLARRVRELESRLEHTRVVEVQRSAPAHVQLGARVRVRFVEDGREATWFIAGDGDGDPPAGRIAYTAPLAAALLGAAPGDVRVLRDGTRRREIEIVELTGAPEEEVS